jgi:hypothetical protein
MNGVFLNIIYDAKRMLASIQLSVALNGRTKSTITLREFPSQQAFHNYIVNLIKLQRTVTVHTI